jgi:hypothetical protein
VLKIQLMDHIMRTGCDGSYGLKQYFQRHRDLLDNAAIDPSANWIDPDDNGGQQARATAEALLERLGRLDSFANAAQGAEAVLQRLLGSGLGSRYTWVGWVYKDSNGLWTCPIHAGHPLGASADLFVLNVPSGDGDVTMQKVGVLRAGRFEPDVGSDQYLVEGRPAYIVQNEP